eukprot:jgi/Orpsp1_1/1192294/evm.model.d7180000092057.2
MLLIIYTIMVYILFTPLLVIPNKMDVQNQGIFLGYSENSTGYRVLDINTKSIINVRDVYFMEDIPGTVDTPFFSSKIIDSLLPYSDFSIEGEKDNIQSKNLS